MGGLFKKMKKNRRAKKDIDTRIHRMCMMAGTSECEMEELGSTLPDKPIATIEWESLPKGSLKDTER